MPQTVVTPDKDAVISEVQIAAPAERIFQALTSSDKLMRWWNGEGGPCQVRMWEIDPRLGGRMRYEVQDAAKKVLARGEAVISGEIVEFSPPRVLAYTWVSDFHSKPEHVTLVRWELLPNEGGTLVKMTHSRLKPLPEGPTYAEGWPGILVCLKTFAEDRHQAGNNQSKENPWQR